MTLKEFLVLQNGSDVRGIAQDLDEEKMNFSQEHAKYIAYSFVEFLKKKVSKDYKDIKIAVGHDSRITAETIKRSVIEALMSKGVNCYDCELSSTPAMFMSTVFEESNVDGAVMITASHLPKNRNGLKFFTKDGGLEKEDIKKILEGAYEETLRTHKKSNDEIKKFDLMGLYCSHIRKLIKENVKSEDYEHPLKGLHIVVDASNGSCGFFTKDILEPLGADTTGSICLEPDGTFPNHIPNPENSDAMSAISKAVLKAKADLGVIFDCDGDRGAAVFSNGEEINRNSLIALMSAIVSEKNPNTTVVTDSVTSEELTEFINCSLNMKHHRFKRGYKNIIDEALKLNKNGTETHLAIETSGHCAMKENYFSDDGAYMCVIIICELSKLKNKGKLLDSLIKDLRYPKSSTELRLKINSDNFKEYGNLILNKFEEFIKNSEVFKMAKESHEGVRAIYEKDNIKGFILVRMSLHDPIIPINIESNNEKGTDLILDLIKPFFEQFELLDKINCK